MSKHLLVTLMLTCGMPLSGSMTALANPEPQTQQQGVESITGTVYDENNEPVIGATVSANGAKGQGVMTDAFGHFTLRARVGAPITIGYVGYKTVEMPASRDMQIYLQPTTEVLDQLVVVGYGEQKRANLTGAVASVDVERTLDSRPVQDVANALQGAVPGLTITTANGDISANPEIKIRGVGSLTNEQKASPLIVVDGVPVDDMSYLNPEDIQDISVLKDAASSSIYGARAAFGVILITTKEAGSKDRVSVKYNNNFAWSRATVLPKFLNTVDQIKNALQSQYRTGGDVDMFGMLYEDLLPYAEAWQKQHGGKPYNDNVELHEFESWDNVGDYAIIDKNGIPTTLHYADWDVAETLFHVAPSQKHNVSLEGQSGKTNYRASFGYDEREDMLKYNSANRRRYMANLNVGTQIFKFLRAGVRMNFSQREFDLPNTVITGQNSSLNPYQYMWRWPGFFMNYGWQRNADGEPMQWRNPIGLNSQAHMDCTTYTKTGIQAWAIADICKGLTLQADFAYSVRNMNSDGTKMPVYMFDNWTVTPGKVYSPYTQASSYASQSNSRDHMWTTNVFATYAKTFAQAHNLKVMLGFTAEREEYKEFYAKRLGLMDYTLPNLDLTNGDTYTTTASNWTRATAGFFGRINYDYKGIYLLEVNGRYDGSSRFPANDQWAFFPSVSAGYRFSEEGYFEPVKSWWSNGKLRASYGHIGNEAVGNYRFIPTISTTDQGETYWINGINGQKISMLEMPTLVSNSLTWERIVTTDVGLDLGFFQNSLNVSVDWFQRDTKDMLGPGATLPAVLGAAAPMQNNGSLRTNGWEVSLGWNHTFGDADIYVNATFADSKTKITKWYNAGKAIYTFTPGNVNDFTEGTYYGDIWGFETDRYFTVDDFIWNTADGKYAPGATQTGYAPGIADQTGMQTGNFVYGPGDVKFKDLDNNGEINTGKQTLEDHGDMKVIGNAMPRYVYSFRIGGAWKGFDLDLYFQGVGKRNMWVTGSTVIPMAQSAIGTFEGQNSYNHYVYNDANQIIGYDVNQSNTYPNMYEGVGGAGKWSANMGRGCYNFYPQDRYLLNMAYLRLKNLTVGYTLPVDITKKAFIQRARIYFSAENLAFLYNGAGKYGLDPELSTSATATAQGSNAGYADFGRTTPMPQTFSFGIQVTF